MSSNNWKLFLNNIYVPGNSIIIIYTIFDYVSNLIGVFIIILSLVLNKYYGFFNILCKSNRFFWFLKLAWHSLYILYSHIIIAFCLCINTRLRIRQDKQKKNKFHHNVLVFSIYVVIFLVHILSSMVSEKKYSTISKTKIFQNHTSYWL